MITPRRTLHLPITLAIVMIVLLVALIVGWVLLTVSMKDNPPLFWTLLTVGTTFLVVVLGGTICYLVLSIKAINLTRRQSNFIASVTHELKSPIASLKLYLQTLEHRQVNEEESAEFRQYMLEDVDRLDHLINHLLDAAQLEKRRLEEDIETIDLPELLRECADSVCLRYRVPLQTIRFDVEPCQLRATRMDADMIFRNLLDNAVKYAGSTPQVEVSVKLDAAIQYTVTRIRDNGQGIPPQLRRKIFGRFERLGLELERKKPGTGLGLYIVRTLVRRLSGRVIVLNADDGPGTVFEVRLPGLGQSESQGQDNTVGQHARSASVTS
ncbi:MAG: HAMP domain-containing histidine kinase [Pirellulaceae bacterium]|nr:HAMP domain-containing histidine kinase [Pirellulaceae bacterium]